jgi:hypothetical protein
MARTAEAHRAHSRVHYALKTGKIKRADRCEHDGCTVKKGLEAAHEDYSKPLDVRWLCPSHHRQWDNEHPKGGTIESSIQGREMAFVDRVVGLERLKVSDIVNAPWNWRTHGEDQRAAVAASLEQLGFYDPLLVYLTEDGRYMLIDGHLRSDLLNAKVGPDTIVPVLVTDLTEDEAKLANITHDPLAALAGTDGAKFSELLQQITTDQEPLQKMLATIQQANVNDILQQVVDETNAVEQSTDEDESEPASCETYKTWSAPLTVGEEKLVRDAIKKAKTKFGVESSGSALARALQEWHNGQDQ